MLYYKYVKYFRQFIIFITWKFILQFLGIITLISSTIQVITNRVNNQNEYNSTCLIPRAAADITTEYVKRCDWLREDLTNHPIKQMIPNFEKFLNSNTDSLVKILLSISFFLWVIHKISITFLHYTYFGNHCMFHCNSL